MSELLDKSFRASAATIEVLDDSTEERLRIDEQLLLLRKYSFASAKSYISDVDCDNDHLPLKVLIFSAQRISRRYPVQNLPASSLQEGQSLPVSSQAGYLNQLDILLIEALGTASISEKPHTAPKEIS